MDFAHARTFVARTGVRFPSLGPIPPVSVHPDTASSDLFERFEALSLEAKENAFDASTSKRNSNSLFVFVSDIYLFTWYLIFVVLSHVSIIITDNISFV